MKRTAVRSDGCVSLGEDAARLGFVPGALVDVIVTRAGSLILALSDELPVEVPFRRLDGKRGGAPYRRLEAV